MSNVIEFPEKFKAKLIHSLKEIGYNEEQIEEAILFIDGNDEDPDPPPKKTAKKENVIDFIEFKRRDHILLKKAA